MSNFVTPWTTQHTSPPSPRVCSNSCPLSWWCCLTISSSATLLFSFCFQSFPASGSFPMSQLFTSGAQSIRASASVLPINIQGSFSLGLTGLISLQSLFNHKSILLFTTFEDFWVGRYFVYNYIFPIDGWHCLSQHDTLCHLLWLLGAH